MSVGHDVFERLFGISSDLRVLAEYLPTVIQAAREVTCGTDQIRAHPAVGYACLRLAEVSGADSSEVFMKDFAACETMISTAKAAGGAPERMWEDAINVQNACNPSGVALSLLEHIEHLSSRGETIEEHPVVRLFILKLRDLCWQKSPETELKKLLCQE